MKLTGNNLVIVNILATYGRIVFSAGLMLFSTRWVLQALGKEDFGLYSVVGGLIVFILFIRMVTASSSQRFFAYTIGQGSKIEIQKWFNFSLSVHFILALVLVLVGIPFGLFFIDNILLIPLEKIRTCHAIYYLSIVASCVSVMTTSSYAVLVANQRIFELSGWETLRGVLVFFFHGTC